MKARILRCRSALKELSPEQAALLVSVGLVLGVFPLIGLPTVLCLLAAFGLRLNVGLLQLLNNISSPLQLMLILPLERAGEYFCGSAVSAGSSTAGRIGAATVHAVTGWACLCLPAGVLLYYGLIYGMRMRRLPLG